MIGALLVCCVSSYAQIETKEVISGTNFSIEKSVTANGGGQSVGTDYSLTGTIGQSSASNDSSNATYALSGGFWASGPRDENIFKNGFEGL